LVSARLRGLLLPGGLLLITCSPEHRVGVSQLAGVMCWGRAAGNGAKACHGTDLLGGHELGGAGQHRLGYEGRVICRFSCNKRKTNVTKRRRNTNGISFAVYISTLVIYAVRIS
jgi:hypothetical protein